MNSSLALKLSTTNFLLVKMFWKNNIFIFFLHVLFLVFLINQGLAVDTTCHEQNLLIKAKNDEKLTRGRKDQSKCMLRAFTDHLTQTTDDLKAELTIQMGQFRENMRKDQNLCYKIEEKYLPFGLIDMVPSSLECRFHEQGMLQ